MVNIVTRKQLYDRVWQQPITHVAKDFGISDVGLRKVCKRHSIPTPPVGYWAKLAHGKRVTVVALPDPDDDHAIRIWKGGSGDEPEAVSKARADALAAVPDVPVAATDHAAIERTLAKLRRARNDGDGLVRSSGKTFISVAVRPASLPRAELVLRQFVGAGEAAGLALKASGAGMAWHLDGESVGFELVEAADQIEYVATDKELAAHARWQREREETHRRFGYWSDYGEPKIPKWDQQYNGRLAIRLEKVRIKSEKDPWGKSILGTFADSRTRDVSRMIPSIVAGVAAMAAAKRSNAVYEERRRLEEEAARQRWQAEERRRYQRERAAKVLDELIELERKAGSIQRWLERIRSSGSLQPRSRRFVGLVEEQLANLLERLGANTLERKLEEARLFDEAN